MASSMQIDFQSTGITRAVSGMNQLLVGLKQFQAAQKALGSQIQVQSLQLTRAALAIHSASKSLAVNSGKLVIYHQWRGALPPGGGGGGGNGGGGGGAASGPFARLAKAQAALQAALRSGIGVPDAQYRLLRAQQAAARAQQALSGGPSVGQKLAQAVLSTRINLPGVGGIGASPLVGRTLSAMGVSGGAAAGITAAVFALVAVFKLLEFAVKTVIEAFRQAVDALHAASAARSMMGGTAGNMAALASMGIDPGQATALSGGLRQALAEGGLGSVYGSRLGLTGNDLVGPQFGNSNSAEVLQKTIAGIAGMTKESDRLRAAMALNLTAALPLIEAYRRNKAAMDADAKARAAIADPETMKAADDFTNALGRVQTNFQSLLMALAKPFIKDAAAWINVFADGLRQLGDFFNKHPNMVRALVDPWINLIRLIAKGLEFLGVLPKGTLKALDSAFQSQNDRQSRADKLADALDRNTDATMANTAGVFAPGTYGGGNSVRGAFPSKWTQFEAATATSIWRGQRLGHFALG